jgi:hypothetical protein
MREFTLIASIFFLTSSLTAQVSTTDFPEIKNYDLSSVFTSDSITIEDGTRKIERPEFLGFFGDNYQRFYIHFISVIQNKDNPLEYFVYGKTKLKSNISDFQGTIRIQNSQTYNQGELPNFKQGYIVANYVFYEDFKQKGTGKFEGTLKSNFLIDGDGVLRYDALMLIADGFSNNEFEGTWSSYRSNSTKICNWGEWRIPNSGPLDNGAGEFAPSSKYSEYGWATYWQAVVGSHKNPKTIEARKVEKEKWWK